MSTDKDEKPSAVQQDTNTEPEMLDKRQTAQLLNVSTRTVEKMMHDGRISYVKLTSKIVRFPKKEILRHIHDHLTVHARGAKGT